MGSVSGTRKQVGGIAGNVVGTHIIRNCYNQGDISDGAGILGRGTKGVLVENCYTVGSVETNGAIMAVSSSSYSSDEPCRIVNCYAPSETVTALVPSTVKISNSGTKSSAEMQSAEFAATLGSAFQYNGGGYPTLKDPEPVVEKNVVSISVKSAKTTCYTGDELELSVTVTYDDNSSEVITKGFTVAGFDNTAPGKQTVTVTYKEKRIPLRSRSLRSLSLMTSSLVLLTVLR